ncbi:hypothetical protein QYF61_010911 [Mycteria americana]|uniref:Uncharacterized protein n=1 Tax=Mycteria americana TaxID=33587 RepID=A0AAN7NQW7_MYCAM|nr:hypothetical protein QYF61_010911 [Mycteria americana]
MAASPAAAFALPRLPAAGERPQAVLGSRPPGRWRCRERPGWPRVSRTGLRVCAGKGRAEPSRAARPRCGLTPPPARSAEAGTETAPPAAGAQEGPRGRPGRRRHLAAAAAPTPAEPVAARGAGRPGGGAEGGARAAGNAPGGGGGAPAAARPRAALPAGERPAEPRGAKPRGALLLPSRRPCAASSSRGRKRISPAEALEAREAAPRPCPPLAVRGVSPSAFGEGSVGRGVCSLHVFRLLAVGLRGD